MLVDSTPPADLVRVGRQHASAGVSDLATFGLATPTGNLTATAALGLTFGVVAAPSNGIDIDVGAKAAFVRSIDAPLLAESQHTGDYALNTTVASAITPLPIPPIEVAQSTNPAEAPSAIPVAPSVVPQADTATPTTPHHVGSGAPPDLLQTPTSPTVGDALETIRTTTSELAQAIASLNTLTTPAVAGADAAIDAARSDLAAIAESVSAIGARQVEVLAPVVDQLQDAAATGIANVGQTVSSLTAQTSEAVAAVTTHATDTIGQVTATLTDTTNAITAQATGLVTDLSSTAAQVTTQSVNETAAAVGDTAATLVDHTTGSVGSLTTGVTDTANTAVAPVPNVVTDVTDTVIRGADPAGGLATLHDLLSAETAFELTDPMDGAVVFSSVTAPVADTLDIAGDLSTPVGDAVGDVVETALPLNDDHDLHGVGHALGGLFDHG